MSNSSWSKACQDVEAKSTQTLLDALHASCGATVRQTHAAAAADDDDDDDHDDDHDDDDDAAAAAAHGFPSRFPRTA